MEFHRIKIEDAPYNRFPDDFYFELTDNEKEYLWFQSGTANNKSRALQHVFTEQGVAMLASVLHTKVAHEVSVSNLYQCENIYLLI